VRREKRARRGRGLAYYESYDPRSSIPPSRPTCDREMVTLAFDGLTRFDPDGRLLPALADRWTMGQDGSGRRYVFHLDRASRSRRHAAHAAAVRASMLRVLSPATRAAGLAAVPIAGAEAYAAGAQAT